MPKELAFSRPHSSASAPYNRPANALGNSVSSSGASASTGAATTPVGSRAVAVSAAEGTAAVSSTGGHRYPRLTLNNFATFRARVKKLPPDANAKAALHTQLFQFPERVCFGCVKCRRDNVESDCVAIDVKNRIMLCTACFTRIVRPRTYTPSRVVPFPSLLSWLNYKPSHVMEMSDNVLERPAEAVAPSGERMAAPMLTGGDRAKNLGKLPAIAMRMAAGGRGRGGRGGAAAAAAGRTRGPTMDEAMAHSSAAAGGGAHPCLRVWGVCQHGDMCLFRNAPADLCIAYLMGLCRGHAAPLPGFASNEGAGGRGGGGGGQRSHQNMRPGRGGPAHHSTGGRGGGRHGRRDHSAGAINRGVQTCRLLHQEVYDLPNLADPAPRERFEGDLEDEESAWASWVRRRCDSPNSAEWQLWHNGPLLPLLKVYVPARRRPTPRQPKKKPPPAPVTATVEALPQEAEERAIPLMEEESAAAPPDEDADNQVEEVNTAEEAEEEEIDEESDEGEPVPPPAPAATTKLNLLDIMSALKNMKKEETTEVKGTEEAEKEAE